MNDALKRLFLSREDERHRHHIRIPTQIGPVFESQFDLFDWPEEPVFGVQYNICVDEFRADVSTDGGSSWTKKAPTPAMYRPGTSSMNEQAG